MPKLSLDIPSWSESKSSFARTGQAVLDGELMLIDDSDLIN